jgi:hypothetical protein
MRLFLSYPRKNKDLAVQLKEVLFKGGYVVWIDDQLITGQPWRQQLEDQIRQADGMVLALTPAWLDSPYCQWEFITAAELGKQVVPVLLAKNPDGSMPDIPQRISQYQWADFSAGLDDVDKIQKFLNDLLNVAVTLKASDAAGMNKEQYAMAINKLQSSNTGDNAGRDINKNIHIGGNVQGANVNIGGTQTFHGNVSITMGDLTQTIQKGSAAPNDKEALQKLMDDLKVALVSVPAEQKSNADKVAKRTEELVSEVSTPDVDTEAVESKANLLKKAADNLKEVLPTVALIGAGIVTQVLKMAGIA